MDIHGPNDSTILIVDDTPGNLSVLFDYLSTEGYRVLVAENGETALRQIDLAKPDLILLDVMMPGIDGYQTCARLKDMDAGRDIPVIFLTSLTETEDKIKGFAAGGVDYITKPFQHEEVLARVHTHLSLRRLRHSLEAQNRCLQQAIDAHQRSRATVRFLNSQLKQSGAPDSIVGDSAPMKSLLRKIEKVAATDSTVLILGETGTGKELVAKALHELSPRRDQPFVKIDCASVPGQHAELELFGKAGNDPGIDFQNRGRLELSDGGSIFLDHVTELPAEAQAKLLRFLEHRQFERVGGSLTYQVNARVIAASNRDLQQAVADGTLREDLFFRLNGVPLTIPPLRERKSDIRDLVEHFFDKNVVRLGNRVKTISEPTLQSLENYSWPGNVRELENFIERALILSDGPELEIDRSLLEEGAIAADFGSEKASDATERDYLADALDQSNWVIEGAAGAARKLGIDADSLRRRIAKLGIVNPAGKSSSQRTPNILAEEDFAAAVKSALQNFIEIDEFQNNPLLDSAMVAADAGADANHPSRVDSLRQILQETAAALTKQPKTELFARILHRTYFQPARSQELAADALGLGYSTFRRHLAKARSLLTAALWQLELQNRG